MMNSKILIGLMLVGMLLLTGCYDTSEKENLNCWMGAVYNGDECVADCYNPCSYITSEVVGIEDSILYSNNESLWITCKDGHFFFDGKDIKCVKENMNTEGTE